MNAKEIAETTLELADDSELGAIAELLARHVLALENDSELQTVVDTVTVTALAQMQRRYELLIEQVGAADDEGRKLLEHALDLRIAERSRS